MNRPQQDLDHELAWHARSFTSTRGVHVLAQPPEHRKDDFDPASFATLLAMQRDHFWYRGRHRLILAVLRHELARCGPASVRFTRAIDLGAGCGGWVEYLHRCAPGLFAELALGDSSMEALELAGPVVGEYAERYQVDLLNLEWLDTWDTVFLLDVIEHVNDDARVLRQVARALQPGGLLLMTMPALQSFWTYNDDFANHKRRYSRRDVMTLAQAGGLDLVRADYFMFFLSPALLASRFMTRPDADATPAQKQAMIARTHRIPRWPLNALFQHILAVEAGLVNSFRFPWGTSILAVMRKPERS